MHSPAESISAYLRAKDQNRPFMMRRAFTADAVLKMNVKTGAISFPPLSRGIDSITEVLVRRFALSYENVLTFCLGDPPQDKANSFSCPWMVGMAERETGAVRVGCGRYDWEFQSAEPFLARDLTITIDLMQILPPETLQVIMDWLSGLPYPWCPPQTALAGAPEVEGLEVILDYIGNRPG
ncbi:MAG: hypothetical protein ACM335_05315 [Deltaproteobacteria bacterium]